MSEPRMRWSRLYSIGGTVGLMWLWLMILVIGGYLFSNSFGNQILAHPLLGITPNVLMRETGMDIAHLTAQSLGGALFAACIVAPFLEEAVFRWFFVMRAGRNAEGRPIDWSWLIVFSGVAFGFLHTFNYSGVFLQGVIGFMLALLWYRNHPGSKTSYFSCVAAHAAYNFSVIGCTIMFNQWLQRMMGG